MFQGAALGYELLAHVFAHLDILETDYFGLQYTDEKSVTRWIDQHKSIKKQTCKQRGQSGIPQLPDIAQLRATITLPLCVLLAWLIRSLQLFSLGPGAKCLTYS